MSAPFPRAHDAPSRLHSDCCRRFRRFCALATLPFVLAADDAASAAARLAPAAALAAGLLGVVVWETIVHGRPGRWNAPIGGAVVGLAAHPLMWALIALGVGVEIDASVSDQVTGAVVTSMFFGVISLVVYGVITAPMGALAGWLLRRLVG